MGIPQLDSLLNSLRVPAEVEAPATLAGEGPSSTPSSDGGEGHVENPSRQHHGRSKPVSVELTSRDSAAGKTTLLYCLSAVATLPKAVGGQESAVVYIDNDGRFSAARLVQIMDDYIRRLQSATTGVEPEFDIENKTKPTSRQLTHEALNHTYVFRPQSSTELISTLDSVAAFLLDRTKHSSIHRPLGLVIIDSATAFYWQDRFDRDMARLANPVVPGPGPGPGHSQTKAKANEILERLQALQTQFGCAVAFSTSSTAAAPPPFSISKATCSLDSPAPAPAPTSPVVSPWTLFATLTLTMSRAPVPRFAAQMPLDECQRDADKRFAAVRNALLVAAVDSSAAPPSRHRETALHHSRSTVERQAGGLGFAFRIRDTGVDFD